MIISYIAYSPVHSLSRTFSSASRLREEETEKDARMCARNSRFHTHSSSPSHTYTRIYIDSIGRDRFRGRGSTYTPHALSREVYLLPQARTRAHTRIYRNFSNRPRRRWKSRLLAPPRVKGFIMLYERERGRYSRGRESGRLWNSRKRSDKQINKRRYTYTRGGIVSWVIAFSELISYCLL